MALVVGLAVACQGAATPPTLPPTPSPTPLASTSTADARAAASEALPSPTLPATRGAESGTPEPTAALVSPPTRAIASPAPTPPPALRTLRLESLEAGRAFRAPTNLIATRDGRALVTEQQGRIWAFSLAGLGGSAVTEFADLTDRVSSRRSEEGLLGLALDPVDDGYMYVYYSAASPRRSVVSRFALAKDGSRVEPGSELVILEVEQPNPNHNGGQIAFGLDGYLYIGLGDGGAAGDPQGHGQDTSTLLGSILRIDVSRSSADAPYAIPADNPFAQGGGRAEIWAYGLRNPWRFSFDRETGELWTGDVGQNRWEEIDLIQRGGNYGWNRLEGSHCFGARDGCDPTGTVLPVWEYSLDGQPCSVIGGYVYRGSAIPWLQGAYVYGDYCSGEVFGLRYADGAVVDHKRLADTGLRIMSFAEDGDEELYLLSQESGIYRLGG